MTRLPVLKPKEVVRALHKAGYLTDRQKASHVFLKHPDRSGGVTVPLHHADMKIGMLRAIIDQADLTVEEFLGLLKK